MEEYDALGYYDAEIDYPDQVGKENFNSKIEGENDQAHLITSQQVNTIVFTNQGKSGKNNVTILNTTKNSKGNNII